MPETEKRLLQLLGGMDEDRKQMLFKFAMFLLTDQELEEVSKMYPVFDSKTTKEYLRN